jgi:hypothetical protein
VHARRSATKSPSYKVGIRRALRSPRASRPAGRRHAMRKRQNLMISISTVFQTHTTAAMAYTWDNRVKFVVRFMYGE